MRMLSRLLVFAALLFVGANAYAANNPSTFAAPPTVSQSLPFPILDIATPQMFGAKCDGVTNDATAFNAALMAGFNVVVSGNCVITGATLTPLSGQKISGVTGAEISYDASTRCAFAFTSLSHIHIEGIIFNNTTAVGSAANPAVCPTSSTDIWIEHNRTIGTGLFFATSTAANYAAVNTGNLNYGLHVNYNVVGNETTTNTIADIGIGFYYVNGFEAQGNTVSGTLHGIFWWGGDANANGAIGNTRWAQNGSVVGNVVHNIAQGCIWGSMGLRNVVQGNTVNTCGDVGFDDEGGVSDAFVGGSCVAATNGCLTTFFLPVGVLFDGISATQSSAVAAFYAANNSSQNPYSTSVTVENCVFNYTGTGISTAGLNTTQGPIENLVVQGNTLINAVINFSSTNQHWITIQNNHLTFTHSMSGTAAIAIANAEQDGTTAGTVRIIGNDISSEVSQASTSAIAVTLNDPNATSYAVIQGNKTYLLGSGNTDIALSTVNTVDQDFNISDNQMGSQVPYSRTDTTGNAYGLLWNNNRADGSAFPTTSDIGSVYWNVGQQFLYTSPAHSGNIGKVETTAGAPGTQYNFGAIL